MPKAKAKKNRKSFKYIYGPVFSWRLGRSLGIDLLSGKVKACSFDCLYCQLGPTGTLSTKRRLYVPTKKIIAEIKKLPKVRIDYLTFSGRGEPTLAINLGQAIKAIKRLRKEPIAVLTNASLMYRKNVRKELALADLVVVKLDAATPALLKLINRPAKKITLAHILRGIKQFRKEYRGKLALQIMLIQKNKAVAKNIVQLVKGIQPDEIQLCTPTRPSAVRPLSRNAILKIKRLFGTMNVISAHKKGVRRLFKGVKLLSLKDTMRRRGKMQG